MNDLCQCARPEPVFETTGGIRFIGGEPYDDSREICYCARCGGELVADVILAEMPELIDFESSEIQI